MKIYDFFDLYSLTVADILASSYVHATSSTVCDVAELAPICVKGVQFLSKLGSCLLANSGDKRETSSLFQRISIAIQRCSAICVLGTFPAIPVIE